MAQHPGIFPTFFLSGFECSTFIWKDQGRRNLIEETQHRRCVREDYALLRELGIGVAREGVLWPHVDKEGEFDFSSLDPFIEAILENRITPIWDLFHYGYPDDVDPLGPLFSYRFANYCRAAAEYVTARTPGPYFFTPVNEINFFAEAGGLRAWCAPFGCGQQAREKLRYKVCAAAIAGVKAIREIVPEARMIFTDPLVYMVPPLDRPDLADAARHESEVETFAAWDILYGKSCPELGGSPEILDIVGPNNYSFGQMEYAENHDHNSLPPGDSRIQSLHDLLLTVWNRYKLPMIIGETSGLKQGREEWLRDVMNECMAAVNSGMDMQGICLFPGVDMPDWHTGEWLNNGICDLVPDGDCLRRVPYQPYIDEIRRWQQELNRVTVLDEDPTSDPVDLADVAETAKRLKPKGDVDWH